MNTATRLSRPWTVILLFIVALVPAHAQTISGVGSQSCGSFKAAYESNDAVAVDSYVAWAQGFVSGHNRARDGARDAAIDAGSLIHSVLIYCNEDENARFYEAVGQVIDNLTR